MKQIVEKALSVLCILGIFLSIVDMNFNAVLGWALAFMISGMLMMMSKVRNEILTELVDVLEGVVETLENERMGD